MNFRPHFFNYYQVFDCSLIVSFEWHLPSFNLPQYNSKAIWVCFCILKWVRFIGAVFSAPQLRSRPGINWGILDENFAKLLQGTQPVVWDQQLQVRGAKHNISGWQMRVGWWPVLSMEQVQANCQISSKCQFFIWSNRARVFVQIGIQRYLLMKQNLHLIRLIIEKDSLQWQQVWIVEMPTIKLDK